MKGKDLKDYWEGDLGVSYIPFLKLKPDIDLEMLEDGGMIDEETMPGWMKTKVTASAPKLVQPLITSGIESAATVPLPEGVAVSSAATHVDTSQPPPVPAGGLLQPPPITLPLVNPFQLNNRLLGTVGMNMNIPPTMMPNVPIGVPPPNLPGALIPNQLLGLGTAFQGPPGLLQQPLPQLPLPTPDKRQTSDNNMPAMPDLMGMHQPYRIVPQPPINVPTTHDDMDVEMEDADHSKQDRPALSDQLLASLNQFNNDNLSQAVNRLHAITNQRPNPGGLGSDQRDDERRDRDRDRNRSRDRDRDRRDRGRRNSHDRNRERERDNSRGDRRDERRDRNRWGDRRDRNERDDRRDREKTLNDRLREMAGMDGPIVDDRPNEIPPPLLDRPMFPEYSDDADKESDRFARGMDDYDHRMRRDFPPMMDMPDYDPEMDVPNFDAPRPMMHRDGMMDERYMRRDRFGDDMRMLDDYDRMRPDFYPPPRDGFGPPPRPPPPMLRGPGPDGFLPRPMLGRPPGPHMFHPRGPPMRGPRPGTKKSTF